MAQRPWVPSDFLLVPSDFLHGDPQQRASRARQFFGHTITVQAWGTTVFK